MGQLLNSANKNSSFSLATNTNESFHTGTLNKFVNERLENSMQNRYKVL